MTSWDLFLQKLYSYPHRKKRDLTSLLKIDEKLGHPHRSFRSIHVGGTNGKGSVTWKIAKALEKEGFCVGLYTSPHIFDVRERIQINGEMISQDDMQEVFAPLFANDEDLSYFDLLTMAAFLYFQKRGVDWAVIEVGLGGRFDATNIIHPEIAAITSISLDHTQLLGETLEEIAHEKGGIVKPNIPLVTGPSASPYFPGSIAVLPQPFFDLENQGVARAVLEKLAISETSIAEGLRARPRCRFEIRGNVILDVAHNPDGFVKLLDALKIHFPNEKFHFILAFSKDKDWKKCLDIIRPFAETISAVKVNMDRMESPENLQAYMPGIKICPSIQGAIKPDARNVICGSFYLMERAQIKEGDLGRLM